MFVDASALAAIVLGEPDARDLAERLDLAPEPITSAIAIYEAVLAVARQRSGGFSAARADVGTLLDEARIRIVSIDAVDAAIAIDAFQRFGKGQGHPARLNLGDCFAYACAQRHRTPLLFKGDDFPQTDVET